MIKRRFYKLEHGDRDAPSESSSSSDSEFEAEASEEEEDWEEEEDEDDTKEENDGDVRLIAGNESSSGYESEHSSADEVNLNSSGLPMSDEDFTTLKLDSETHLVEKRVSELDNTPNNLIPKEECDIPHDASDYVLKCKTVFKCRLCPRIVCLTVQTLNAHLKSKRHARSEKLLKEGRLKFMLSEDGKIEGEIHPEETSNGEQKASAPKKFKKNKGLKRERKGKKLKKNKENSSPMEQHDRESRKNQSKKRQKNK